VSLRETRPSDERAVAADSTRDSLVLPASIPERGGLA
jgi:hypothetical protein